MTVREVDPAGPGLRRRRAGRGFSYYDEQGRRITDTAVIDRIKALAIPPAWTDVWICPEPSGHIQACGLDARRRRQYRYHEERRRLRWRGPWQRSGGRPRRRRELARRRPTHAPGRDRRRRRRPHRALTPATGRCAQA